MTPDAISALATCIYCVAFVGSLWFIYRQLDHTRKSTIATAFAKAVEILQDENRRKDRGLIFSLRDAGTPYEKWDSEQRSAGERVCHSYDQVGIMIRAGMFPKELVVDSWGYSLRNIWPILKPLVTEY